MIRDALKAFSIALLIGTIVMAWHGPSVVSVPLSSGVASAPAWTATLPISGGGVGPTSAVTCAGGAMGGHTCMTSSTSGKILYNSSGTLGEPPTYTSTAGTTSSGTVIIRVEGSGGGKQ